MHGKGLGALLLLAAAVLSARADDAPPAPTRTVEGRVLGEDGAPVAGAAVALCAVGGKLQFHASRAIHAETDAAGRFRAGGVASGDVEVVAIAEGFVTARFRGRVHDDGPSLELRVRRGCSVRVRVEDAAGTPLRSVFVGLFPAPHVRFLGAPTVLRLDRSVHTNADGDCVLTGLDERNYEIAAGHPAGGRASVGVCGGATAVRLVLDGEDHTRSRWIFEGTSFDGCPPGEIPPDSLEPSDPPPPPETADRTEPESTIIATVLTAEGVPVPHVRVRALAGGDTSFTFEYTSDQGVVTFTPPDFVRVLEAEFPGRDTEIARADVPAATTGARRVTLRFASVHAVRVEVRDAEGRPVPRAALDVRRGERRDSETAGDDGRATLFAARGTPLRVVVLDGDSPVTMPREIAVPQPEPVVIAVPAPRRLAGRVVGPDGAPLFGVRVLLVRGGADPDEAPRGTFSDDRGEFTAEPLLDGPYTVTVRTFAFGTATASVDVPEEKPVVVRLAQLVRVHGRVVGPDGDAVAGALVACDGGEGGWAETGDDGSFTLACSSGRDEAKLVITKKGFEECEIRAALAKPELPLVRLKPEAK